MIILWLNSLIHDCLAAPTSFESVIIRLDRRKPKPQLFNFMYDSLINKCSTLPTTASFMIYDCLTTPTTASPTIVWLHLRPPHPRSIDCTYDSLTHEQSITPTTVPFIIVRLRSIAPVTLSRWFKLAAFLIE